MGFRFSAVAAAMLVAVLVLSTLAVGGGTRAIAPIAPPSPALGSPPATTLPPSSFYSGMDEASLLGKTNFTSAPALANAATLCNANSAAFDREGDLWVADYCNNRVLEFVPPFSSSMAAALVLGQPNFSANGVATTARGMDAPSALAFDSAGDLWVVDSFNNRVLEFIPPFSTGMAASLVLGQTSFGTMTPGSLSGQLDGPDAVAFDPAGDLWVAEFVNNRLTEFVPPFANGMSAAVVVGQPTFGPSEPGVGANHFRGPFGIAFNATGAMWVGDANNNRVLAFDPPFSDGASADLVLGQPNFTANAPGVGAAAFYGPNYLSFDASGDLWVGDTNNNRVLEFPAPVTARSQASLVLGQPNLTSRLAHTSATGMSNPALALVGAGGGLFVVEFSNSRVTEFLPPFSNGEAASLVLGQTSLTQSTTAPTATNLGRSASSAYDAAGNLWVADTYDNRVLEFPAPVTFGESARVVLGQSDLNDSLNGPGATHLFLPAAIAFAPDGDLWVSDTYNSRLLEFAPPFVTGMAASVVLGQPNFTAVAPGTSARSLALPAGIAFDPQGNLWVADGLNSRVLEFVPPFETDEAARLVVGQSNFTGFLPGTSPTSLFFPGAVAFDANGTLYVADTDNNRVLAYPAPITTGESATSVVGQTNLYSGGPGVGPGALDGPSGLAVDPRGTLWVADAGNNRVVGFPLPMIDGSPASVVLGQPGPGSNAPGTTASSLRSPAGVALDPVGGGIWVADYGNSRLVYFPGNALAVATGVAPISGGRGTIDQRSVTGVQLNFTSVSGTSSLVVVTQRLAGLPEGVTPADYVNATYFDVAAAPLAGVTGVVQVCLTVPGVNVNPNLLYWNGVSWALVGSTTASHSTACGSVPLSALVGTPIALSVPGPSTLPSFPTLYLFGLATLGFLVVVGVIIGLNLRKQRRLARDGTPPAVGSPPLPSPGREEPPRGPTP